MSQSILITGVSSGLGYGLAEEYLKAGATVYGCSRRKPEELVDAGLRFAPLDLSDEASAQPELEKFIHDVDQFELVILNAAKLGAIRDMAEAPLDDLRETMEINVWANKWLLDTIFGNGCVVKQVVQDEGESSLRIRSLAVRQ